MMFDNIIDTYRLKNSYFYDNYQANCFYDDQGLIRKIYQNFCNDRCNVDNYNLSTEVAFEYYFEASIDEYFQLNLLNLERYLMYLIQKEHIGQVRLNDNEVSTRSFLKQVLNTEKMLEVKRRQFELKLKRKNI